MQSLGVTSFQRECVNNSVFGRILMQFLSKKSENCFKMTYFQVSYIMDVGTEWANKHVRNKKTPPLSDTDPVNYIN